MYEDAIRLMGSEDLNALIFTKKIRSKERYGEDPFGQGCLLARRLIECDVRAVEVSYTGWDTHSNHFTAMPLLCQTMDKVIGALLDDLQVIGKLENTIVVLTTEFGRTPIPNKNSGRDHYPKHFPVLAVEDEVDTAMAEHPVVVRRLRKTRSRSRFQRYYCYGDGYSA